MIFLAALLRFCFKEVAKNLDFQSFFLSLTKALVATFNGTCIPTSRKYVAEQVIIMPNL